MGLQSLTACRVLEFSIDVLRERYSIESRHTCIFLEAFLYRSQHSSHRRFRLLLLYWCWCNTVSLRCVCAVFRHGTGVPLCSAGLPRVGVRQAVRDKHVVGAHAVTGSGYWRSAGVCRTAGVAVFFRKSEPHTPFGL